MTYAALPGEWPTSWQDLLEETESIYFDKLHTWNLDKVMRKKSRQEFMQSSSKQELEHFRKPQISPKIMKIMSWLPVAKSSIDFLRDSNGDFAGAYQLLDQDFFDQLREIR